MSLLNQIKQAKTHGGVVIALARHMGIPVRPVSENVRSKHPIIAKTTRLLAKTFNTTPDLF